MTVFAKVTSVSTLVLGLCAINLSPHAYNAQSSNKSFQQKVADNARLEWMKFNPPHQPIVRSRTDVAQLENDPTEYKKCQTINKYWAAVQDIVPPSGNTCLLNIPPTPQGKGQLEKWDEYPWSAAFISYIMKKSGARNSFAYSGRHATYIIDSVKKRDVHGYPFRGYPINKAMPEIGDLVCAPRGDSKSLAYSQIVKTASFKSHCDIVVAKKDGKYIEAIGGNVGDTVSKTVVPLTAAGYIKVTDSDFRPWFVIIKNSLNPLG